MAVTITDRRTTIDDAEAVTNWTNVDRVVSTDVAEQTNAVANPINIGDQELYYTYPAGSANLSSKLVYVYSFNNALQNAWDNTIPPNAIFLGDGTNQIAFHMAGTDRRVFNHLEGPTNWQCLVLDIDEASNLNDAGHTYVVAGSFASLDFTQITQVGAYHETLSKALGGGYNVACDILRYGNDGVYITGGGIGTEGTFVEIAAADRSTADGAGHGMIRAYTSIAFGVQGPLTFGRSDTATDSYFEDTGVVVVYEDRDIGDDKYYFTVEGNSAATNNFEFTNSTLTTAGPGVEVTASGSVDYFYMDNIAFVDLQNDITFALVSGTVTNCTFTTCGQINPGCIDFSSNTISSTTASGLGALLLCDDTPHSHIWTDITINFYEQGHGIYITSSGTYTFDNVQLVGYGATGTTDAGIYNDSGGLVTIYALGGSTGLTYRNGAGASTTIISAVTITLINLVANSEVRIYDTGTTTELEGIEDSSTSFAFTVDYVVYPYIDIVVHHLGYVYYRVDAFEVPTTAASLPVQQQIDRWYGNP